MKILNRISLLLVTGLAFSFTACDMDGVEEATPQIKSEASIPVINKVNQGFYNLLDLENAFIDFSVGLQGDVAVEKVEVYQKFGSEPAKLVETIASLPADINISLNDAAQLAGLEKSALQPGETFNYTFVVYGTDGQKFLNSTVVSASALCPSEIPEGTYTAISGGTSTDGCPPENPIEGHTYTVTVESKGAGNYTVSDFSAGIYQEWYGACYGYTFETAATIQDVCNNLSFSLTEAFSCAVEGSGKYNAETGVITYTWSNCFGDTGFVELTPQE